MKPSDFYTRTQANEGVKLPLALPDGTPTEHYLIIRGVDSDAFQRANDQAMRAALEAAQLEDEAAREEALERSKLTLMASLVAGWSFDEECTREAVEEFLREAPQLRQKIDRIAGDRARFFRIKSGGSLPTPSTPSGSSSARKTRKSRSKST